MVNPDRPWVRLACDFYEDEGMYNVHAHAELLYARALAHSKRARAAGFVHVRALAKLTARMEFDPASGLNPEALAQQLVDEALWTEVEDGWMIRSWSKWQESTEQELEQQKQTRSAKSKAAHVMHHKNGKHAQKAREGCPMCNVHAGAMHVHAPACSDTDSDTDSGTSNTSVIPAGMTLAPKADPFESEFADWWQGFPRKVHRSQALKAYKARRREGISADDLGRAVASYAIERDGEPAEFTMHGATFLAKGGPWSERLDGPIATAAGVTTRGAAKPSQHERNVSALDAWAASFDDNTDTDGEWTARLRAIEGGRA